MKGNFKNMFRLYVDFGFTLKFLRKMILKIAEIKEVKNKIDDCF